MNAPEVKYLEVFQQPDGTLTGHHSKPNIEVYGSSPYFETKLTAYENLSFNSIVSFRFPSDKKPLPITTGARDQWLPVYDGETVRWIFAHRNPTNSRYETSLYNTAGELQITDGKLILNILIEVNCLTKQDLEEALSDFKNQLIKIIFSDSPIFVKSKTNTSPLLTNETLNNIKSFNEFLKQLIPHLKTRLVCSECRQPVHKAQANAKGLIEYISNPSIKNISSKKNILSHDTGENRLILSCAKNVLKIIEKTCDIQNIWVAEVNVIGEKLNQLNKILQYTTSDQFSNLRRMQSDLVKFTQNAITILQKMYDQDVDDIYTSLKKSINLLENLKISSQPSPYNPMTIAQNHGYRKLYKSYIKCISNCTTESLDWLNKIDRFFSKVSIPTIPYFYEKWCYVKIINTLLYRFNGIPKKQNWQELIINACLNDCSNITLPITIGQNTINLIYQGTVDGQPNETGYKKTYRPDFIIEIDGFKCVLDAKFRTYTTNEKLFQLAQSLALEKNYSHCNTAPVFIIHSSPNASIKNMNYANSWTNFCNYGANNDHMTGHIFLSPQKEFKYQSSDNLVRLLILIFQNKDIVICPNCGSLMTKDPYKSNPNSVSTEYFCPHCSHKCFRTHCFKCRRTLWKNGNYWTYHNYRDTSGNVLCPHCHEDL